MLMKTRLTKRYPVHECILVWHFFYCSISWTKSYLLNRSFYVNIQNSKSSVFQFLYGVPQGSVLGTLLFILYTTPLSTVISNSSANHQLYADDTQYLPFHFSFMEQMVMLMFSPPKVWFSPQKVCGLIGLKNVIMVKAIQLMRLFRNAMTVSKIFSSTEAKMVHIWPNLRSLYTDSSRTYSFPSFNISARDDDVFAASTINLQLSSIELYVCSCMVLMQNCYINYKK